MPYPDVLACVHGRLAAKWNIAANAGLAAAFGRSIGAWPAFADSAAALAYLKQHFKLIILSNVDRRSFATSNERLDVSFDAIITAQDVGSYKPDPRNFAALSACVEGMGIDPSRHLHVAQSLYHDHVPAITMGLATAWIQRGHGDRGGATVSPAQPVHPTFTFDTLGALAEQHRRDLTASQ